MAGSTGLDFGSMHIVFKGCRLSESCSSMDIQNDGKQSR